MSRHILTAGAELTAEERERLDERWSAQRMSLDEMKVALEAEKPAA